MGRFSLFFISCSVLINFWLGIGPVEALVGGLETVSRRHQYIVGVYADQEYFCVGTVIGKYHVLTAGHCVIGRNGEFMKKKFSIVAGVVNLLNPETVPFKTDVKELYVPRVYSGIIDDFFDRVGDLAVLKVKNQFPSNRVQQLYLPSKVGPTQTYLNYEKHTPTVFGFGVTKRLTHAYTTVLKQELCKQLTPIHLDAKHICAQIPLQSAETPRAICHGDFGAPLVDLEDTARSRGPVSSRAVVIGILVHYSTNCDEASESPIYTRITSFIPFIEKAMASTRNQDIARIAIYEPITRASTSKVTEELTELIR